MTDTTGSRNRRRSNGEGGVWWEADRKRWKGSVTVGYDANGRQLRRFKTGQTKAEVLKKLREVQDLTDDGIEARSETLTVAKMLDEWTSEVLPGRVAKRTEQQYEQYVRLYIKPAVGQKRLRTLAPRDVTRMVNQMDERGLAPNTQRLARSILRRALHWAEGEGMVSRNVAHLSQPPRTALSDGRTLTVEEAHTFLDSIHGDRLEGLWVVMLSLGLRVGEALGLAWDMVDLDASPPTLSVRRALKYIGAEGDQKGYLLVEDVPKTKSSRRTLNLPGTTVDHLRAHRKRMAAERLAFAREWPDAPLGHDLVFRNADGGALDPSNVWHHLDTAARTAGLGHWHPHELRHSAASLLWAQGIEIEVISELLGHSSIRITKDLYAHMMAPAKAAAAAAMDRALSG